MFVEASAIVCPHRLRQVGFMGGGGGRGREGGYWCAAAGGREDPASLTVRAAGVFKAGK